MLISTPASVALLLLIQYLGRYGLAVSQHLSVYVSKVRGNDVSRCGSIAKPCKTLAYGFAVLLPGGHLYVDGEQTQHDPYTCKHTGRTLLILNGFTMISYRKTAYVSCPKGITIKPKHSYKPKFKLRQSNQPSNLYNPEMMVIFNKINFKKTTIVLQNATVIIKDCIFEEGSPALRVVVMQSMPTFNVTGSVFEKNNGCIQVYTTHKRCETLNMNLQNVVFTENSGNPAGVVHIYGALTDLQYTTCSLKVTINNITVYGEHALAAHSMANYKRKQRFFGKTSKVHPQQLFRKASRRKPQSLCFTDESFIEIRAENVTLQITNTITIGYHFNMRFLNLNSRLSSVNITNSSFYGHHVNGSGGVLFVTLPKANDVAIIKVTVDRSHFSNNVAEISGGVLSITGQIGKKVVLAMVDTTILYSYGISTGCAIDTGNSDRVHVKFDRFVFQSCQAPCNEIDERKCRKQGSLHITTRNRALIYIQNSLFSHNLNNYQPTLSIQLKRYVKSKKHNFQTYIENVTFTKNTSPTNIGVLQVYLDVPYVLQDSLVRIVNSTFSKNTGKVMEIHRIRTVQIENLTFIDNNGMCFEMRNYRVLKDYNSFYVNVLIRNSLFENSGAPLVIRHTRPQHTNITIEKTIFRKNVFKDNEGIKIKIGDNGLRSNKSFSTAGSVTLDHVQFTENRVLSASGCVFGVAVFFHKERFYATIRNTVFKDNFQEHRNDKTGISDLVFLYSSNSAYQLVPNDTKYTKRCKMFEFPAISYFDHVTFENVTFKNNTAHSNIIYINNGKTTFRRCLFENNYSHHPRTGTYIFAEQRWPSLVFESSVFNQTQIRIFPHSNKSDDPQPQPTNIMPFVYFRGQGPFVAKDSHFIITASEEVTPMFIIENARFVHFDNTTQFSCPVGSYIKLDNSSHIIPRQFTYHHCQLNITRLKFTCRRCPVGTYSLQRGILRGTQLKKTWIKCNRCPYGGNCMENVISKRGFWGYEEEEDPPQLKFEHCPVNYCLSPSSPNPAIFNDCHGNRTGVMCGSCKRGFTESMFNHKCRLEKDCHDGWFWVTETIYSIVMALYIMHQPSIILYLTKKLLWFRESTNGSPPLNSRVEQMRQLGSHTNHGYSKVVFYFYQIAQLIMLESCTEILRRKSFISMLISFYSFHVELVDDSLGCPFPGLNVVTKELFLSLQVYVVIAWILFFYLVAHFLHLITGRTKPSIANYIAAIVEVLLLGYERLGHTSLELLSCTPLKMNGRTEWRLFLDGNITCWVHWWQYALIAYNIIFIVPFLVVLLVGTTKLRYQQISPWMFVAACFVPLPFLICWGLTWMTRKNRKRKQHAHRSSSNLQLQSTFFLLNAVQGPFRPPDSQSGGTLYWESVLIGRRFVLLCLRSFIASPLIRLLCMTIVCILVLVHNIFTLPYKEKKTNYFSIVALFALVTIATINLTKASLIAAGVQPTGVLLHMIYALQKWEVTLLAVLPGVFALLVIAVLISQIARLVLILKWTFKDYMIKINTSKANLNSDNTNPLLGHSTESLLEE